MERAESTPMRVFVWSRAARSGLLGLATCLRAEPGGHAVRAFLLPDAREPFGPAAPAYKAQVQKDLACNVLRGGVWGSYRHIPLADMAEGQLQVGLPVFHSNEWLDPKATSIIVPRPRSILTGFYS